MTRAHIWLGLEDLPPPGLNTLEFDIHRVSMNEIPKENEGPLYYDLNNINL